MPIASVTTLDGHTVDVSDLSEEEQLYCLILASNEAEDYDGRKGYTCLIGRAGGALGYTDYSLSSIFSVTDHFSNLRKGIFTIYDGVTDPPYDTDFDAALRFAARVLGILEDRAAYLRKNVIGGAS